MILQPHDPRLCMPAGAPTAYTVAKRRFINKYGSRKWNEMKPDMIKMFQIWECEDDLEYYLKCPQLSNAPDARKEFVVNCVRKIEMIAGKDYRKKVCAKYGLVKNK